MGEPVERGKGVGLVREAEGRLVAAESIVAVEPGSQPEAIDDAPEIVGRVLGLGAAHLGGPAPVVGAGERVRRQWPALAADRGMDAVAGVVEIAAAGRDGGKRHRLLLGEQP
jgi:hypothetical protein